MLVYPSLYLFYDRQETDYVMHTDGPTCCFSRKHVVFGKVVEGLKILKKIEAVPTSGPPRNKPNVPVKIVDCGEVTPGKENGGGAVKEGKLKTVYCSTSS